MCERVCQGALYPQQDRSAVSAEPLQCQVEKRKREEEEEEEGINATYQRRRACQLFIKVRGRTSGANV